MRPTLPLELIYLCIEASSDSFAALGQLSLVSKECASEARKYIFKHIVLDRRERAVDLGSQHIRTFLELLTANKTLATYIHILFIKIEPSTYAATEVYAQTLPAILDLLTDLTIFQMDGLCPDYSDWNALPERLRSSITRRCSAPSITMLHFSNLKNLPHAPLRSAPGLLKISLVRVRSPQGAAENGSTGPGGSAAANLECFSVVDAGWVAGSYILADPGALSSLRRMSWYISDQRDLDLLKRVLQKCGGSLEELHIGFHHDHSNDGLHIGELVSLPQLRLLTFNSDTCLDLDADAGASSSLGSHLRLFLDILRTQHQPEPIVLVLNVTLRNVQCSDITRTTTDTGASDAEETKILRPEVWEALDEHLSSQPSPALTILGFTLRWECHCPTSPASETEKRTLFKTKLLRETPEVLVKSYRKKVLMALIEPEGAVPAMVLG